MRSIRCSESHEGMVRKFGESPFSTMREFLCFTATLGFERGEPTPLSSASIDIVDGRIFSNHPPAVDAMYMIGVAHNKNLELLDSEREDELVSCFESYAETGLRFIQELLAASPGDFIGTETLIRQITTLMKGEQQVESGDPHEVGF